MSPRACLLLLAAGALLCAAAAAPPSGDIPALINAAGAGDAEKVIELLEKGASANELSPDGESPLHVAAIRGSARVVSALLAHGAAVDARTPPGVQRRMTPLQWASYGGHREMVKLLLRAGADAGYRDEEGKSAADMAREAGHEALLPMLEEGAAGGEL